MEYVAEPVFPNDIDNVDTATGIHRVTSASSGYDDDKCCLDHGVLAILDPFSAHPSSGPFQHGQPSINRRVMSTKSLEIKANSVMWVVWWYRADQLVQAWVRDVLSGRYYPCAAYDVPPSLKLSDDYTQMSLQASGVSFRSATISGGTFAINGQITAATLLDPPDLSTITDSSLLSYALGPNAAITQVPIVDGVVSINPPSILQETLITPDNGNVFPIGNNFAVNSTWFTTLAAPIGWTPRAVAAATQPANTETILFTTTPGGLTLPNNTFGKFRIVGTVTIGLHNVPAGGTAFSVLVRVNRARCTNAGVLQNFTQDLFQLFTVATAEVTTTPLSCVRTSTFDYWIQPDTGSIVTSVQIIIKTSTAAACDWYTETVDSIMQIRLEFPELYGGGYNQYCTAHILSGVDANSNLSVLASKMDHYALVPNSTLVRNANTKSYWSYNADQRLVLETVFRNYADRLRFVYQYSNYQNLMKTGFFVMLAGGYNGEHKNTLTASSKFARSLLKGVKAVGNVAGNLSRLATVAYDPLSALVGMQAKVAGGMGNFASGEHSFKRKFIMEENCS
jgi:hypothetical protein